MTSLSVTIKGQTTLKQHLLQHPGTTSDERVKTDKLPDSEQKIKTTPPAGTIDNFCGLLADKKDRYYQKNKRSRRCWLGW